MYHTRTRNKGQNTHQNLSMILNVFFHGICKNFVNLSV